MKHWRFVLAAFSLSILSIAILLFFIAKRNATEQLATVHPGEEVYATDPNLVSELRYRSGTRNLVASRPGSESPFQIEIVDAAGRAVEKCAAGPVFSQALATLLSIKVRRPLTATEEMNLLAIRKSELATVSIADSTGLDPQAYRVLVDTPGGTVFFLDPPAAFESTVPASSIEGLERGCSVLRAPSSP